MIGLAFVENDKSVLPWVTNELANTCTNTVEFIALDDCNPEEIGAGKFVVSPAPEVLVIYRGCDDGKGLENGVVRVEFDKFEFVAEDSVLALKELRFLPPFATIRRFRGRSLALTSNVPDHRKIVEMLL